MSRLAEIEAFVAVAEHGSFAAAAPHLQISSSYASKLVSRLEDRLGVQLIQRTTRRHTLTPHGERYLADCQDAFRVLRQSEDRIQDASAQIRGPIRLTAPTGLGLGALADILGAFAQQHPAVELDISLLDRKADLVGEGFDLAIRAGRMPDSSARARRLSSFCRRLVASPQVAQQFEGQTDIAVLNGVDAIVYSQKDQRDQWELRRGTEVRTVRVSARIVANAGGAMARLCAMGMGVAYIPTFHTADLEREGRLVRLFPEWGSETAAYVVYPQQEHLPRRVRALIDHLSAAFQARERADLES